MPEFSVNTYRIDPYKNFKFRVKWDGKYIAGVNRVSGLIRRSEVIIERDGGEPSAAKQMPGLINHEPIMLQRGVTHDSEFERWANKVWKHGRGGGAEVSLKDFRKDITIELLNEAGQLVIAYRVYRCWPSEYVALGELNANCGSVAFESLTIRHEGWERDTGVAEPAETAVD